MTSILSSWKNQPLATSILRLWLGATWVYGGWSKATDSGYLNRASTGYIGAQLTGYVGHSPISFLLRHMIEHAQLIGWFVMLSEFAIGIALLAGVAMQLAVLGGASMSLILWLSVTWNVSPYFLGSDTAYLVMWIALFFLVRQSVGARGRAKQDSFIPNLADRREVIGILGTGVAAVVAALAGGSLKKKAPVSTNGTEIVKLADFPIGSTKQFADASGNPAILFRTKSGVYAYSAVCTHQGCTVAYDSLGHLMRCPCHGATYDSTTGAVLSGPAPQALPKISVAIKGDAIVAL